MEPDVMARRIRELMVAKRTLERRLSEMEARLAALESATVRPT